MVPDNILCFRRTNTSAFKPRVISANYHHRFELVVPLDKAGPARIGDVTYTLRPYEAALIFPNQFHHYMDVENGQIDWLFITFELQNYEEIAGLKGSPRTLDPSEVHLLALIAMEYAFPATGSPDVVEISHHLLKLLRSMIKAPLIAAEQRDTQRGKHSRDVLLEKINHYVRSHLKEAPTIDDLAKALNYSVSHMRVVFRTQLGISLGKYIRESRLSHAARLFHSTNKNISEVAEECGFNSLFAFSRAFKKTYGMAPKAYSKLVQQG